MTLLMDVWKCHCSTSIQLKNMSAISPYNAADNATQKFIILSIK